MPFPLLIPLAIAIFAGGGTAVGTKKAREYFNEGETIYVSCRRCHSYGPHLFDRINRSVAPGLLMGFIAGIPGGLILGITGKRIFKCRSCGADMYEDGSRPGATLSERLEGFSNYPDLKDAIEDFQNLVANNQTIAAKHHEEIARLQRELDDVNSDKEILAAKLRTLINKMWQEAA